MHGIMNIIILASTSHQGTGSLILGDGAPAKELRSLGTFYLISCPKEQKYTWPTKQVKKCVRDILSFLPYPHVLNKHVFQILKDRLVNKLS